MKKILLFFVLTIFLSQHEMLSQNCGAVPSAEFISIAKQRALEMDTINLSHSKRRNLFTLGVQFWEIHGENENPELSYSEAETKLNQLNLIFSSIGVKFEMCGNVRYIADNALNQITDLNSANELVLNNNYNPKLINVYLFKNFNLRGFATFPSSEKSHIILRKNYFFGDEGLSIFTHEMGHFFGLFHTFGTTACDSNIPPENVDGSEWNTPKGDFIQDTPPDCLMNCLDNFGNPLRGTIHPFFCSFIGINGYENYHPMVNNFMCYVPDASLTCRDRFTQGQINWMIGFTDERRHLVCSSGQDLCSDSFDPNENRENASTYFGSFGATNTNSQIQGKIGIQGDLDFFKIQFNLKGYLNISLSNLPKNYNLELYKGITLINHSSNPNNDPDNLSYEVSASDLNTDFYILVYPKTISDFDCDNSYNLAVSWVPDNNSNSCPDEYEPNNSKSQPATPYGSVLPTQYYTNTISGCMKDRGEDWFKFVVPKDGIISLSITGDGFVGLEEDGNYGNIGSEILNTVTYSHLQNAPATFYIKITPKQCSNCGIYSLTLEWRPNTNSGGGGNNDYDDSNCPWNPIVYTDRDKQYEPNNNFSNAYTNSNLIFDSPRDADNLYGYILSPNDIDYYKFQANQRGIYQIFISEYDYNFTTELFNSNNQLIKTAGYNSYYGSDYIEVVLDPGQYFVKVYSPIGEFHCQYAKYDLDINLYATISGGGGGGGGSGGGSNNICNPLPDANAEPNESFATAFYNPQLQNITQGGMDIVMSSYISSSTDVDVYRLELNLEGLLRFEYCAPQNLNATFEVFNSNGIKITNVSIGNCNDWSLLLYPPGTYYVMIKAQNGAFNCSDPYTFRFKFFASPSGGGGNGGGNSNPWDCSEAILLERNAQTTCQNAWSGGCPLWTFGSTINRPNRMDNYTCAPFGTFNGGEKLYKVRVVNSQCNRGLGVILKDPTGDITQWGIHLFSDCNLTQCITNNLSEVDVISNSTWYQFEVPDGDYYILVDALNGYSSDFTIYTYGNIVSMNGNMCYFISSTDPPIITIDYSDQNQDCSCGNIQNPTITQTGSFSCVTSTTLTAEAICTSGFEIQWFNSLSSTIPLSTGQTLQVTQPGLYFAESVQISTGCKSEKVPIIVSPPSIPVILLPMDATCGMSNGAIKIEVPQPDNTSDYQYLWSNGQTASSIQGLARGIYTVTITNADGCSVVRTAYVGGSDINVRLIKQVDDCVQMPQKLLQAIASSSYPILAYKWSTGDSLAAITSTAFGVYSITVTDGEGCTTSSSIQVENKSLSTLPFVKKPSCKGKDDGYINLSVFHGVSPISYNWNTGSNNASLSNLTKGNYIYTVVDARGCEIVDTVVLNEPDSIIYYVESKSPKCWDSNNGEIAVFVQGGTRFYNYKWNNGISDNRLTQLDGGVYVMTVTDWNGCMEKVTISLAKPDSLDVFSDVSNVPCEGMALGKINLLISGGTTPYHYLWQTGDTIPNLSNLIAGEYNATITDANGCTKSLIRSISQPDALNLLNTSTDVSCYGGKNGSINVQPSGGTIPYNVTYNNGNGRDLSAGQYIVSVLDGNGCISKDTVVIYEPLQLKVDLSKSDVSCAGMANGSATATISGGTQPYDFKWEGNPSNLNTVKNLSAGLATFFVKDANNCRDTFSIIVTQPPALNLGFSITDESCKGKLDGEIIVNISGGTSPYTYNWNNGVISKQNIGLAAGAHSLTITDANNCHLDSVIIVQTLPPLTFDIKTTPTTCSYTEDGTLKIENIIGISPFSVIIDNGIASTSNRYENIKPGHHALTLTDGKGCFWKEEFEIVQPLPLDAIILSSLDSLMMGETVNLSVISDNYFLTNIDWQPHELVNCVSCPEVTSQPFYNQLYKVTVRNEAGCEQRLEKLIKVSKERPIFAPNVFSPNGDGSNDNFTIYGALNATQIKYLRVFDRWGNLLFERKNFPLNAPELGWDGLFKGRVLDSGVYLYSAEIEFIDKQIFKYQGDVSIFR